MKTRNIIDITNHPQFPSITRKAQVRCTNNRYSECISEMAIDVFSYLDGVELKDMARQAVLVATNAMINPATFEYAVSDESGVYPEGSIVKHDIYPDGSIGEYDYLFSLIQSKAKSIFELEEMYISIRVGTIDKQLYNL